MHVAVVDDDVALQVVGDFLDLDCKCLELEAVHVISALACSLRLDTPLGQEVTQDILLRVHLSFHFFSKGRASTLHQSLSVLFFESFLGLAK